MKERTIPTRVADISERDFWSSLRSVKTRPNRELLLEAIRLGRQGEKAAAYAALAAYHGAALGQEWRETRAARKSHPLLAVSEHPLVETMPRRSLATGGRSPGERLVVAINHSATPLNEMLSLNPGWMPGSIHRSCLRHEGGLLRGTWPSNDAIVFEARMTNRKARL